MDTPDQDGKQLIGARLKYFRETAGLSVVDLEKKTKRRRTYLYKIEAGKANFSIELLEELLKACGVTLAEFLTGMHTAEHRAGLDESAASLYRMLDVIVDSRIPRQIEGTRVHLENASLNVQRIARAARSSPNTEAGQGAEHKERAITGSPPKKRRAV